MKRSFKKTFAVVLSAAVIFSATTPVNVFAGTSEVTCLKDASHIATYHEAEAGSDCKTHGTIEYYECATCGNLDAEGNTLDDLTGEYGAHNMTHHEAVAGTDCQTAGTIEYWSCNVCSKNYKDEAGSEEATDLTGAKGAHTMEHHEAVAGTDCQTARQQER